MTTKAATLRRRLEMQGFVGECDARLAEIGPWLRLAPALCMAWTLVGTTMASAPVLWALMPLAALGAILRSHPFDVFYNWIYSRRRGAPPLPRYRAPRRFACALATIWLGLAGLAFYSGALLAGYVLGLSLALAALVPTLTDFCIPSFLWGVLFGKPAGCR